MRETCLSVEELEQAAALPPPELAPRLAEHLERCAACREALERERAAATRDAQLFAELRSVARRSAGVPEIPGYLMEGELSRGGQGVVHLAVQEATQRRVALKVLGAAELGQSSARERRRFEREIELGSRLAHPGIVTVFDSGRSAVGTQEVLWYAMELVDGERLDAYVARLAPPLERRLALFLELCAAVAHAHRAGVLHRDLKPANVLVDAHGRVRVLDFGTALPVDAELRQRMTAPGEFLGTLAYAAPEQLGGDARATDTRSDVYSLGVVLYELTTGALPYDVGRGLSATVASILHDPPAPPSRHVRRFDPELAALLGKALAKDPERRYSSVDALAEDCRRFLERRPLAARSHDVLHVLLLALRRRRRAVLAAAALFAAGGALVAAALREHWRAERAREDSALVSAVIQDVLGAAAPQRMGGDARLLDVLALASREIETTLAHAPDAQVALQLTLGDTYRRLLMNPEAETHLRSALERLRAESGDELEIARCLHALGLVLAAQNRPDAITVHEEALTLRRSALGAEHVLIAESQRGLAQALLSQFRVSEAPRARTLLLAALERQRAAHGAGHPEVAETQLVLARLDVERDPATAEALLAEALATFDRHAAEDARDPRRLDCLTDYSAFLARHGRLDEAEVLLVRAARLTEELYGDELAPEMLRRQANLRYDRKQYASAEELTRRALAVELMNWARSRPEEAGELESLSRALADARPGEEPRYTEAFQHLRRFRGDGAFELAQWMNGIAIVMLAQGRSAPCEPLLREALGIRCRAFGADCPVRARTLYLLASVLSGSRREREAIPLLEESVRISAAQGAEEPAAEARTLLASCCRVEAEKP